MTEGGVGNNIPAVEVISLVVPKLDGGGGEEGMEFAGRLFDAALSGVL